MNKEAKKLNPLTMTDQELIEHCNKQVQALRMALDMIECEKHDRRHVRWAIVDALKEWQPAQQEPVAWKHDCAALLTNNVELWIDRCPHCGKPCTSPPASKPWAGLTDEDIKEAEWLLSAIKEHEAYTLQEQLLVEGVDVFARAIEAKLKEKNT